MSTLEATEIEAVKSAVRTLEKRLIASIVYNFKLVPLIFISLKTYHKYFQKMITNITSFQFQSNFFLSISISITNLKCAKIR